jgi:hypothetical protein
MCGNECKVSHVLYKGYLKLRRSTEEKLRNEIRIVETVSNNIKLSLDKGSVSDLLEKVTSSQKTAHRKHWRKILQN